MTPEVKRIQEKKLLSEMVSLYCKGKKHSQTGLCSSCEELREYAWQRSDKCPYMETKTFCVNCKTHCYKPDMRERIRAVMRYSGPRMLIRHPVLLVKHVCCGRRGDRR